MGILSEESILVGETLQEKLIGNKIFYYYFVKVVFQNVIVIDFVR